MFISRCIDDNGHSTQPVLAAPGWRLVSTVAYVIYMPLAFTIIGILARS